MLETAAEQLKELDEKEQEIKLLKEQIARKAKEEEGKQFFDDAVANMKKYFFNEDLDDEDKQLLEGHFDFNEFQLDANSSCLAHLKCLNWFQLVTHLNV